MQILRLRFPQPIKLRDPTRNKIRELVPAFFNDMLPDFLARVFILNGNLEIGAYVLREIGNLICLTCFDKTWKGIYFEINLKLASSELYGNMTCSSIS